MDDLIEAALSSNPDLEVDQLDNLARSLKKESIITDPKVHSAIFGAREAATAGLPVLEPHTSGKQWQIIWRLWTKYFTLMQGTNQTLIYESRTASQVLAS